MFKKEDLKNGMVVEFNDGSRRLLWEDKLIDSQGFIPMGFINDELLNMDDLRKAYIVKIFLTHNVCYFTDFLRDKSLTCIWSR